MLFLLFVALVIGIVWYNMHQSKIRREYIQSLIKPGDNYSDIAIVAGDQNKVGVQGKKVAFAVQPDKQVYFPEASSPKMYFLTGIEFQAQFDSQIKGRSGSALVGGALFGAAGAVVGGSRGKKVKTVEKNSSALFHLIDTSSKKEIVIELWAVNTSLINIFKKNYLATDYDLDQLFGPDSNSTSSSVNEKISTDEHIQNVNKRLANLKSLLDQDLIEQTEFDAKKKEILGL